MKLRAWFWMALMGVAISQVLNVGLRGPRFVLLGGISPDPDETFSSVVGRAAAEGRRLGLVAEWLIDRMALPFEGWRLGHCRRAAARTLAGAARA